MLSIRKINPMVRAIGTMGAVAALVSGITFASVNTNTVALTNNTITTGSLLAIGDGTSNSCTANATTAPGMSVTGLYPGGTSSPFYFCITNNSLNTLPIYVLSPTDFTSSVIPAADITLNIQCVGQSDIQDTLASLASSSQPGVEVDTGLGGGDTVDCSITANLSSSYASTSGSVTPFELDFTGVSSS